MTIREYEELVKSSIVDVVVSIINNNKTLAISAKSRAGAEVSDFFEEKFVEYTRNSSILLRSEQAPKGKTKNPWDAKAYFKHKNHEEEIWIDFKAFKITETSDSNPDIGTPNKIFDFINRGGFYLLYVYVYYKETSNGLEFVSRDGKYVKSYYLKDVNHTFRRTPTNQLQVNIDAEPEYRTREEFVNLLTEKVLEGLERQLINAQSKLISVRKNSTILIEKNIKSEQVIKDNLQ